MRLRRTELRIGKVGEAMSSETIRATIRIGCFLLVTNRGCISRRKQHDQAHLAARGAYPVGPLAIQDQGKRKRLIEHLEKALTLADSLTGYLIERALDEARAGSIENAGNAGYANI